MAAISKLLSAVPVEPSPPAAAPPQDEAARFALLLLDARGRVVRLVHRLLGWSSAEVEDVVQEVFLAAMTRRSQFRGEAALATWLAAIAVNRCRSHQRGLGRRLRLLAGLASRTRELLAPPPEEGLQEREMLAEVRKAVRELPARAREVVVLRYLEGFSPEQTAEALGLSRGAVEVRLHRARRRLKARLGPFLEESS